MVGLPESREYFTIVFAKITENSEFSRRLVLFILYCIVFSLLIITVSISFHWHYTSAYLLQARFRLLSLYLFQLYGYTFLSIKGSQISVIKFVSSITFFVTIFCNLSTFCIHLVQTGRTHAREPVEDVDRCTGVGSTPRRSRSQYNRGNVHVSTCSKFQKH